MATKSNYVTQTIRDYNTVDQSDSGMTRSDETKSRVKEARTRMEDAIDREKRVGAGRGLVNPDAEGKKAGGSVKGWGKARGARKAKVY